MLPHRVAVETYLGDTGTDDTYAAKASGIPCRAEGELLVDANGGYNSAVKLFLQLDQRDRFTRESRVTLEDGTVATVQAVAAHDGDDVGAWSHLEVACA